MARLLTAGFETGSIQELNGATYGAAAVSSDEARTGTYSLALLGAPGLGSTAYQRHVFDDSVEELYFRLAWKLDATGIAGYPELRFGDQLGAVQFTLRFEGSTQTFKLYLGDYDYAFPENNVLLASGITVLRAGIWYLLEGMVSMQTQVGEFVLKINSATDLSDSGAVVTDGTRALTILGPVNAPSTGFLYIDDVACNDAEESFENSYPGLGGIFFLKANGDGATTDWTRSAGSDDYALVDEVPANTTDWVQGENPGDLELFDIENTPTYVTAINVVQPVFQTAVAVSGSNEIRDVVRADSVNYPGDTTHTVISIAPDYVLYRGKTYYEHPDGVSGALAAADLDALQVGFEIPA